MASLLAEGRSIAELIRGILNDMQTLVREEIALARIELRQQAGHAKASAFGFGVAAGALGCAALFLLVALALGIANVLAWPLWAGFLVVATLLAIVGAAAFASGRRHLQRARRVPEETVSSLKENSEWIAKRLSSGPR